MLARGAHHRAADGCAPGEEEVIERQGRERGASGRIAGDNGDLVLREDLGDQSRQDVTRRRRELRRLDHHAVAGGEGGRERHQRERERVVPRSHDADNPERLVLEVGAAEAHRQRDVPALGLHEASQVLVEVVDTPREWEHLHDGGLVPGAVAEVGIEGRFQISPAREKGRTKFLQACPSLGERRRPISQESRALPGEQAGQRVLRRGGGLQ